MRRSVVFFTMLAMTSYLASAEVKESIDTVQRLESVSVTASRAQLTLGASARIVTVMDSLAISTIPAQTVNDLLKYAAGVDVRQRGVMGMQTDISVRGGTFDQVAILLNGINICDPQTGHNAVDFPVSISEIDRIEVLEGPAARVYGTSSLVGAINIVTKKPQSNSVSAHLEGGSFGYFEGGANVAFSKGRVSGLVSASTSRSDGYSRNKEGNLNSDFEGKKTFANLNYDGKLLEAEIQGGYTVKDFGSNTFYSAKYDDQFEHTQKAFLAVQGKTKGKVLSVKPALYWNHGRDRFELFRGKPDAVAFNYHRTNTFGVNLGADLNTKAGITSFGTEIRNEGIVSTNLGNPLEEKIGEHYVCGLDRTNISIYADHSLVLKRFTISGGISAVKNTGNDAGFGLYPGIDASWRIGDAWKLYGSWNTSLRQPTFTELFYSVGGHKADPNLRPERMQSLEGGIKYLKPGVSAVLSVYYHRGTDMIDWIKDLSQGDAAAWESVNYTKINTLGEELSLRFDLPVLLGNEAFPITNLQLGYAHIDQDKDLDQNIQSRYALEYLRNKATAQMDVHIWKNLFWNVSLRWMDRKGSYEKFENCVSTGTTVDYEPYTLLDSRLSWNAKSYRLYVEADNILNRTYYDYGNIPQPGIWCRAGVSFTLGF